RIQHNALLLIDVGGEDGDIGARLFREVLPLNVRIDVFGLQFPSQPGEESIAGIETARFDKRKQFAVQIDLEQLFYYQPLNESRHVPFLQKVHRDAVVDCPLIEVRDFRRIEEGSED